MTEAGSIHRAVPVFCVLALLTVAAPVSAHDPVDETQHDGGTPGDASDLCRDPFPTLDHDATTSGRLVPVPPLLPVSDTTDNYALDLSDGETVTITTGAAASTLLHDDSPSDEDEPFPGETAFRFQVWAPDCSEVVADGEPTPGSGEEATFTADVSGTYTVEVFPPPLEAGLYVEPGAPAPGVDLLRTAPGPLDLVQRTCHPNCEAVETLNLLAGYSLSVS